MKNYFRRLAEGHESGLLPHVLYPLLAAASQVCRLVVFVTQTLYKRGVLPKKRLPFPVVSVGNITWGGTGKTPFVEYLAYKVCGRGRTPLILTRGYGRDEEEQLRRQLPRAIIGVGKNRSKIAAAFAQKQRIHLAILDDGFQHWPIERDIDIITINALNPFGNGKPIPLGILREPVCTLRRAAIIVISHINLVGRKELDELRAAIRQHAPDAFIIETFLEPLFFYRARKRFRVSLDRLGNRKVTTFSGIGMPRSFQMLLSQYQIKAVRNFEFVDHHPFTVEELKEIKQVSESAGVDEILTTEKDFYRNPKTITDILNPLVLAARLRVASGEDILTDRLFRLLGVVSS